MDPEARLLRYFLAVAAELNFTRAAATLHIAQPSLSAQIRGLERQLGVTLFRRNTHSVALTEAGQALMAQGPRALSGLERAWQAARDAGRGRSGTLRIAYSLSAGHDTVPALIEALHEHHSGIVVRTELLPTPGVLTAVRDGRADLGVARVPGPLEGVHLIPVRREQEGVLLAAGHPLTSVPRAGLAAVAEHPVVLHPRAANPTHHDFIHDLFASRDLRPEFVERDIALDLSHRVVTDGTAVELVGQSAAIRLPSDLRWVPLIEPVHVTFAVVLPAVEPAGGIENFARTALAHATRQRWLEPCSHQSAVESEAPAP